MPIDGPNVRLMRSGLVAHRLRARGHHVTWWSATVDHMQKRRREGPLDQTLPNGIELRLLRGLLYRRNVSIARLVNHAQMTADFALRARRDRRPDVIYCGLPTADLAAAVASFSRREGVPLVVDVRDRWPDAIVDLVSPRVHLLVETALTPMALSVSYALGSATAITGVTPDYVTWGLARAGRAAGPRDQHFPNAYDDQPPTPLERRDASGFWDQLGLPPNRYPFVACYVGTLGHQSLGPLTRLLDAAERLRDDRRFLFVIAGTGEAAEVIRQRAVELENVLLPGWIGRAQIQLLMERSTVGLLLYDSGRNLASCWPNKSIEYMAGGLPIVSTLRGAVADLITEERCGLHLDDASGESIASALVTLADRPEERDRLADRARELFRERFTAARVYEEFCSYLEGIAAAGR